MKWLERARRAIPLAPYLGTVNTAKTQISSVLVAPRTDHADDSAAQTAQRCGLTIADLKDTAGPDWPECQHDSALLETVAHAIQARRMRETGTVPAHYIAITICAGCGPVPIFEGAPATVLGCPWCLNRAAGRPVPRVNQGRTT